MRLKEARRTITKKIELARRDSEIIVYVLLKKKVHGTSIGANPA